MSVLVDISKDLSIFVEVDHASSPPDRPRSVEIKHSRGRSSVFNRRVSDWLILLPLDIVA